MGIRRQRMVVIDTLERRVVASTETAYYSQPESFSAGLLVATKEPFRSAERVIWHVPEDLAGFKPVSAAWTEAAQQDVSLHESSDRLSLCEVGRFSSQEMIHER